MTKKDRILRLWAQGKNRQEVAAIVPLHQGVVQLGSVGHHLVLVDVLEGR